MSTHKKYENFSLIWFVKLNTLSWAWKTPKPRVIIESLKFIAVESLKNFLQKWKNFWANQQTIFMSLTGVTSQCELNFKSDDFAGMKFADFQQCFFEIRFFKSWNFQIQKIPLWCMLIDEFSFLEYVQHFHFIHR